MGNGTKKVVAIGGGTGLSTILRGLKSADLDLTAIVTVADDGGSSGVLRKELKMPPPGDIRNVLVALAEREPLLQSLFQHRFENGNGLAGHTLGNLLIAGMQEITGDFADAVRALSRVLAVRGRVLPATNEGIRLQAKMEDGTVVVGESSIPKAHKKIERVSVIPENAEALPEAVQAIREADAVLIGPGSLYTSILPNVLVRGIQQALCETSARIIYISNVMTQPGETDGFDVRDHVQAIVDHVGKQLFDTVIVNSGTIPEQIITRYSAQDQEPVTYTPCSLSDFGVTVIADTLFHMDDYLRHNEQKVTQLVLQCVNG